MEAFVKKYGSNLKMFSLLQVSVLLFMAFAATHLRAQSYGSITGTVTDPSGASVPHAGVTITNLITGEKRAEQSNGEGIYRVLNLNPGNYREDVELTGFKHSVREPIKVDVETTTRVDMVLSVGAANEVVEVTSQTPLLQTESATLQDVVDGRTVQEMPLNGKNVENLIALTPGVVAQGSTANATGSNQSAGHTNSTGWNNYQIGGGQPGSAAQFLDGAPTSGLGGNTIFLVPNQDSVGEFRVATAAVSPEFGRFGGGVVNFTTKSGGNDWHGSAYEYFRNKALNAATYFGKQSGQPKAAYNQNQFGGTLGGHIVRDKLFLFANYEQYKIISGSTFTALVPTAAERRGDFSAAGEPAIYDPLTSVLTGSSTSPVTRTQISCNGVTNVICPGRIDSTANVILNTLSYYPLPNVTGQQGYNFAHTVSPGVESMQGGIRLDYNISQKQHLFARYTQWNLGDIPLNQYGNVTGGSGSQQISHSGVIGDTYTFTQKFIGDVRLSYGRGFSDDLPPTLGANLSIFGPAYASLASQVSAAVYPTIAPSGYGAFRGMSVYDTSYRNTIDLAPGASYLVGRHALKFGANVRFLDFNYFAASNAAGGFNTDTGFTSANGLSSGPTGNAIASLLLGYVSGAAGMGGASGIGTAIEVGQYSWYRAFYVQDTWQAARNFTVNGGIRYELPGAWFERRDRADVLLPNAANPLGNGATGGLFLVNSAQWGPRSTEQQKYNLVSPRLGFVYSPNSNTSFRAGYSLIYLPLDTYNGAAPANAPFVAATTTMVTASPSNPYIPTNTLSDPFPAGGVPGTVQQQILQPVGRSQSFLNNLVGLSISGPVPQPRYPYTQQWTASLQQQFSADTLMQIAYLGNRGTFLPQGSNYQTGSSNNLNQLPDQYDSLGSALYAPVVNPFAGRLNPTGPLNGAMVTKAQSLLPYPQYTNVVQSNAKGDSIYHAMIVSLRKRLHGGGEINSNYTWAKLLGNVPGTPFSFAEPAMINIGSLQDYTNPRGDRSVLNTDIRNRFVTSFVLPLPFGKGQRFLRNAHGVAGGFVNGWGTNGIVTFQTGYNLSVSGGNSVLGQFGAGTVRPDYVQGCQKQIQGSSQSRVGKWFNTACFGGPTNIFTFGNEPRVDGGIRAAGIANYDFSVSKDTGLSEHLKLQLKAEMFNLFNRVQFAAPATTLGRPGFGTVTDVANQPRQIQVSGRLLF